ncbi:MAG: NfeD-like protein [Ruminococcaceae bacterium]|nr:NfeD-like protein [Oscillospiraceae bacterium]
MFLVEWWNSLGLVTQIFYCIAVPATLVLLIQTILMFFGIDDGVDGDVEFDAPDADFDGDGIGDDFDMDIDDVAGLESLHIFTVRGIIAFFVIFGWVGVVMQSADINLAITLIVATICGFAIMVLIAYLFKLVMRLKSNGTADNRNALGKAGKVYLTIPPSRSGEGKVNIMLQGAYVERNAVTDETEAIPTGCEIIVIGTSGQTSLVVKRK